MNRLIPMLGLLLVLVPLQASAQISITLPYGLDVLHWNDSQSDASAALAPFGTLGHGDPADVQASLILASYKWQSCEFRVVFRFAATGLNAISLTSRHGSNACATEMQAELDAHFGSGNSIPDGPRRVWILFASEAIYSEDQNGEALSVTVFDRRSAPIAGGG